MTNVSLDLPDELALRVRARAAEGAMSLERWITGAIRLELGDRPTGSTLRDTLYRGDWPREQRRSVEPASA